MMKNMAIVKLLLKHAYRSSEKNRGKAVAFALIAVVYLFFEVAIVSTLVMVAPLFRDEGLMPEFLTAVMVSGLACVTTLGIMPMLSLLYFSKDSEFFLSLPLSPSVVYFSKLFTVYLSQLAFMAAILLPALYGIGISVEMNWSFYVVMLFATLVLPVFPLMFVSVLCLPLMYIIRFFKHRGAVASAFAMILFIALYIAYMLVARLSVDVTVDTEIVNMLRAPVENIARVFLPLLAINRFATFTKLGDYSLALSMLFNFFIFVVPALLLLFIALIISRRAYSHAVAVQLENVKRNGGEVVYQRKMGVVRALIIKEWKDIVRTPAFTIQCFVGLMIAPVMIIVMGVSGELKADTDIISCIMWLVLTAFVQLIVISVNVGASTSISRDGGAFYLAKLLPVSYEVQIRSKTLLYNMIFGLGILICVIAIFIMLGTEIWWFGLLLFVYLLIYNYAFISFCILMDLSKPKLDWKSHREIVKNSRNSMLPMFIGMAVSLFTGGISVTLFIIVQRLTNLKLAAIIIVVVMIAIAIVLAFVIHSILKSKIKKFYDRIEA